MRQRKSSPINSKPPSNGASTTSDKQLDLAYRSLAEALRLWRREPDAEHRKQALIEAVDARDDALARSINEEEDRVSG